MPEGRTIIEAYKIGITVALTNQVSSILGMIARDFAKTDVQAQKLQKTLKEIKLLGAIGVATAGAGFLGLKLIDKAVEPAREYAHQLNIMNMAGLKQAEIAQSIAAAWKNTGTVITSTATGNLKALMDMRNVLQGGLAEAVQMLPITSKIAAVMASSSDKGVASNADNIAFSVAKAMDIMGLNTPEAMEHGAGRMSQVIAAFQNKITPDAIAATTFYARQARYDMDDFMRYGVVPSMMLERAGGGGGGGSKGIGPSLAAVNRVANIGIMTNKTAGWFEDLGLLHGSKTPSSSAGNIQTQGLDHSDEWAHNAFLATWKYMVPAMQAKYGADIINHPDQMRAALTTSRMTQTAMSQFMEWVTKPGNTMRDAQNVGVLPALADLPPLLRDIATKLGLDSSRGAMPYDQAYKEALKNDPMMASAAAAAQWDNLKTVVGNELIPIIIPALHSFADGLHDLTVWAREHPDITHKLVLGFTALSAALAFSGAILTLTAAFKALGLLFTAGGLIGGGGAAGGLGLIITLGGIASAFTGLAIAAGILFAALPSRKDQAAGGPLDGVRDHTLMPKGIPKFGSGHPDNPVDWLYFGDSPKYAPPSWSIKPPKPKPAGFAANENPEDYTLTALANKIIAGFKETIGSIWLNMDGQKVGNVAINKAIRRYQSAPSDTGTASGEMTPILNGGY